jgi:hypothetical protein
MGVACAEDVNNNPRTAAVAAVAVAIAVQQQD